MSGYEDVPEPCGWPSTSSVVFFRSGFWLLLFAVAVWPPAAIGAQSPDATSHPAAVSTSNLSIKPAAVMVTVGEPQRLRLVDASGKEIRNGTWTVSDPAVVEISNQGDVLATGLKPGKSRWLPHRTASPRKRESRCWARAWGRPAPPPTPSRWKRERLTGWEARRKFRPSTLRPTLSAWWWEIRIRWS